MYNPDTNLLFPPRLLPALADLRSPAWEELVNFVMVATPESPKQVAFILMVARMNNCGSCISDSYRAKNGCTICTIQSLKRLCETDKALTDIFHMTSEELSSIFR